MLFDQLWLCLLPVCLLHNADSELYQDLVSSVLSAHGSFNRQKLLKEVYRRKRYQLSQRDPTGYAEVR